MVSHFIHIIFMGLLSLGTALAADTTISLKNDFGQGCALVPSTDENVKAAVKQFREFVAAEQLAYYEGKILDYGGLEEQNFRTVKNLATWRVCNLWGGEKASNQKTNTPCWVEGKPIDIPVSIEGYGIALHMKDFYGKFYAYSNGHFIAASNRAANEIIDELKSTQGLKVSSTGLCAPFAEDINKRHDQIKTTIEQVKSTVCTLDDPNPCQTLMAGGVDENDAPRLQAACYVQAAITAFNLGPQNQLIQCAYHEKKGAALAKLNENFTLPKVADKLKVLFKPQLDYCKKKTKRKFRYMSLNFGADGYGAENTKTSKPGGKKWNLVRKYALKCMEKEVRGNLPEKLEAFLTATYSDIFGPEGKALQE